MKTPELMRCPFCHKVPVFYVRGQFWRGGCEEHLPDAVMQPVSMYDQAIIQWNNIVEVLARAKEGAL